MREVIDLDVTSEEQFCLYLIYWYSMHYNLLHPEDTIGTEKAAWDRLDDRSKELIMLALVAGSTT